MKKIYIQPIITFEAIEGEYPFFLTESNGWSKDGNPPTNVEKESSNPDDWGDGNDDDGWGDFIIAD